MISIDYHGGNFNILYSNKDHKRQRNIFSLQLFFMRLTGQLPMQLAKLLPQAWMVRPKLSKQLAYAFCAFCIFSMSNLAVLFLKTTYDMLQRGELEEITDSLTLAIIYSFAAFAICYWLWNSKAIMQFINEINRNYRHHSIAGLTFVSVQPSVQLAYKITLFWLASCMFGVVCWALTPLLMGSHTLPLKCWYPFDALAPITYELLYVLQLWSQFIMGCTFGNGSAVYVSVVIIMLGQFDVLYCSLKNLNFHAQLLSGEKLNVLRKIQSELPHGEDDELNQYAFSKEFPIDLRRINTVNLQPYKTLKQSLHQAIVECVMLHQFILKSCKTLEELFNPYCLVKSMQITLQLCLLVFVGVAGESSTMRVVNLVQYLALTLSELLMFTYCGELLSQHSIRAGEAFWRSQWWTNAHLIKRDILIFLVNTRREVRITAGKFYFMDVQRLRSVVTQAFSFLTLLQKLAEKNK